MSKNVTLGRIRSVVALSLKSTLLLLSSTSLVFSQSWSVNKRLKQEKSYYTCASGQRLYDAFDNRLTNYNIVNTCDAYDFVRYGQNLDSVQRVESESRRQRDHYNNQVNNSISSIANSEWVRKSQREGQRVGLQELQSQRNSDPMWNATVASIRESQRIIVQNGRRIENAEDGSRREKRRKGGQKRVNRGNGFQVGNIDRQIEKQERDIRQSEEQLSRAQSRLKEARDKNERADRAATQATAKSNEIANFQAKMKELAAARVEVGRLESAQPAPQPEQPTPPKKEPKKPEEPRQPNRPPADKPGDQDKRERPDAGRGGDRGKPGDVTDEQKRRQEERDKRGGQRGKQGATGSQQLDRLPAADDLATAKANVARLESELGSNPQEKLNKMNQDLGALNSAAKDRAGNVKDLSGAVELARKQVVSEKSQLDSLKNIRREMYSINQALDTQDLIDDFEEIYEEYGRYYYAWETDKDALTKAEQAMSFVNDNIERFEAEITARLSQHSTTASEASLQAYTDIKDEAKKDGEVVGEPEGKNQARGEINGLIDRGLRDATTDGDVQGKADAKNPETRDKAKRALGVDHGTQAGTQEAKNDALAAYQPAFNQQRKARESIDLESKDQKLGSDFSGAQKYSNATLDQHARNRAKSTRFYQELTHNLLKDVYEEIYAQYYAVEYEQHYGEVKQAARVAKRAESKVLELSRLGNLLRSKQQYEITELDIPNENDEFYKQSKANAGSLDIGGATTSSKEVYAQYRDSQRRGKSNYDSKRKDTNEKVTYSIAKEELRIVTRKQLNDNESEINRVKSEAQAQANKLFNENAIVSIDGFELVESEQDGVFRPGEAIGVNLIASNYGKKAATNLALRFRDSQNIVNTQAVGAPSLPGQTRMKMSGIASFVVNPNANDGDAIEINLLAVNPNGITVDGQKQDTSTEVQGVIVQKVKEIGSVVDASRSKNFSDTTLFPFKVAIDSSFEGLVSPDNNPKIKFIVTNQTKKGDKLDVRIKLFVGNELKGGDQSGQVLSIQRGQSEIAAFDVSGRSENRFDDSFIKVNATRGGQLYARDQQYSVVVIDKHSYSNDSRGLIVSDNMGDGDSSAKYLYRLGKFDTWDYREKVDKRSGLSSALAKYIAGAKSVNLVLSGKERVPSDVLANLRSYVEQGGSLVLWGNNITELGLAQAINSEGVSGTSGPRPLGLNGTAAATIQGNINIVRGGVELNTGLKLSEPINATRLNLQDPDSRIEHDHNKSLPLGRVHSLIRVNGSTVAAVAVPFYDFNRSSENVGRVYMVSLEPRSLYLADERGSKDGASFISLIMSSLTERAQAFSAKMSVASKDAKKVYLVVDEILEEVRNFETTFRQSRETLYGKKSGDSRLAKAIGYFMPITMNAASRTAFGLAYSKIEPRAHDTFKNFGGSDLNEFYQIVGGGSGFGSSDGLKFKTGRETRVIFFTTKEEFSYRDLYREVSKGVPGENSGNNGRGNSIDCNDWSNRDESECWNQNGG